MAPGFPAIVGSTRPQPATTGVLDKLFSCTSLLNLLASSHLPTEANILAGRIIYPLDSLYSFQFDAVLSSNLPLLNIVMYFTRKQQSSPNPSISSNIFRATVTLPVKTYPLIIPFQEATFLSGICRTKDSAWGISQAFAYPAIIEFQEITSSTGISSNTLRAANKFPALKNPNIMGPSAHTRPVPETFAGMRAQASRAAKMADVVGRKWRSLHAGVESPRSGHFGKTIGWQKPMRRHLGMTVLPPGWTCKFLVHVNYGLNLMGLTGPHNRVQICCSL
ncbi:hypothetical protein H6P81_016727 [Aristolochia fimbriata]|uniref:Uncharacterized protein n=1 Tax=Aristolochia fimbriata TaxID=158543 RepID=A0AAV7E957_ARIFI|nr:hypothetical protein H6P81_016727 [Aristolochia fimbriata]